MRGPPFFYLPASSLLFLPARICLVCAETDAVPEALTNKFPVSRIDGAMDIIGNNTPTLSSTLVAFEFGLI